MFDYARKMQLAVTDVGRRAGLKAGAGAAALLAGGFLLAALWTFLADTLGWGPLAASLVIGVGFLVIAGIIWALAGRVKHPVPPVEELKREVQARANLAAEAALDKARDKAREVVDLAENKATALMDQASYKASALVDQTEAKVQRFTHQTIDRAARRVGLTPDIVADAQAFATRAKSSKAMPAASILGAFAVGLTLASRLRGLGRADEEVWDDEVWEDEAEEAGADWGRE